jgi:hypothetical protein
MNPDDTAIQAWLHRQPVSTLTNILARLSAGDERARRLILLHMAAEGGPGGTPDIFRLSRLIEQAIVPTEYVREEDEFAFGRGTDDVIDVLHGLLARGFAAAVRDLCVHAMSCADRSFENLAEGWCLVQSYGELVRLHLAACRSAPPLRQELADWLARMVKSDWTDVVRKVRVEYEALLKTLP